MVSKVANVTKRRDNSYYAHLTKISVFFKPLFVWQYFLKHLWMI